MLTVFFFLPHQGRGVPQQAPENLRQVVGTTAYNALNLNQPINNQNDGNDVTDPATDIALCLMKFKEAREEKKNVICLPCGAALFSSLIIVSEIVCRKSASLKKLFVLWRLLKASSRPR